MKNKVIRFSALAFLLIFALVNVSCGGTRVYCLAGEATMHILNEKGKPFKKEDASRFEVRTIGYSGGHDKNIEKDDLVYIVCASVSGKVMTVLDTESVRNREEEILLQKLKTTQGIVVIDKNNEYKPKVQYLTNATITKKTPSKIFGNHYEFEDFVMLEKK